MLRAEGMGGADKGMGCSRNLMLRAEGMGRDDKSMGCSRNLMLTPAFSFSPLSMVNPFKKHPIQSCSCA